MSWDAKNVRADLKVNQHSKARLILHLKRLLNGVVIELMSALSRICPGVHFYNQLNFRVSLYIFARWKVEEERHQCRKNF
jgi:hypothetical protein